MTADTTNRSSFYPGAIDPMTQYPMTQYPMTQYPMTPNSVAPPMYVGDPTGRQRPAAVRRRSGPAAALAEAVYAVISFPLALAFFISSWVMCSVGAGLAVIWVGVPVLAFGLLIARFGAFLQLGLYESMTGQQLSYSAPQPRRRGRGPMGTLAVVITDPGSWRALAYWMLKMVLAPAQFAVAIGFYCYGLGTVSYPFWRRWLPAQQASDGSWHRGSSFGTDFFVDTWPRMLVQMVIGIGILMLAPAVVRAVNSIDRVLIGVLVAGRQLG